MTVVLHKHEIACGKGVLFTYICCRKALGQLQYQNIAVFSEKTDVPHLQNQSMVAISVMKLQP